MEAAIGKLGANVCPVRIHHRIAYPRAQQTGLTAQEFEPEGKVAHELQRLWQYVFTHVFTNRAMNHAA